MRNPSRRTPARAVAVAVPAEVPSPIGAWALAVLAVLFGVALAGALG